MNFAAFWQRYIETLPEGHPHIRSRIDAFSFGDSQALADELADLVHAGRKRATTSLAVEFAESQLPRKGDVSIVTRFDGRPVAIIELTEVRQVPFREVDAAFAAEEGEGDGQLDSWRKNHEDYFSRVCKNHGEAFSETTPVICQKFRVVMRA